MTYTYRCWNEECGHVFDAEESMKDDAQTICPECGEPTLKRVIFGGSGVAFKGTGFHCNDYSTEPVEKPKRSRPPVVEKGRTIE